MLAKKKIEKRRYKRKKCFISISLSARDRVFTNYVSDISIGGMFIETDEGFEEGQFISIKFLSPYKLKGLQSIIARVTRCESKGIAVSFKDTGEDQTETIKIFMDNL